MKFAILHHDRCHGTAFHYRIDASGATTRELADTEPGEHAKSIGIVIAGDLDTRPPSEIQLAALKSLLLALKKRYPDIQIGGHRQVRGDATTCPGKHFPLTALREWSKSELIAQRDAAMREEVDRQYYRR